MSTPGALDPFPSDRVVTTEEFAGLYRTALDRLAGFGLRLGRGDRLSKYRDTLDRLASIDHAQLSPEEAQCLANAVNEASILVDIASLPDEYLHALRHRLVKLNGGREIENEDHDPARDAAVELQVAARCNVLGTLGDPATERGDLLARVPGAQLPIEVKRVSSIAGIRNRVRQGVAQISFSEGNPATPGAIILDISSASRRHFGFVSANSPGELTEAANQQTTAFLNQYIFREVQLEDLVRNGVLGLIVRNGVFGSVQPGGFRRFINTHVVPTVSEGSAEEALFFQLANAVETGRLTIGSDEALRIATELSSLPPARKRDV